MKTRLLVLVAVCLTCFACNAETKETGPGGSQSSITGAQALAALKANQYLASNDGLIITRSALSKLRLRSQAMLSIPRSPYRDPYTDSQWFKVRDIPWMRFDLSNLDSPHRGRRRIAYFPLDEIPEFVDDLAAGKVTGHPVFLRDLGAEGQSTKENP